MLKNAGDQAVMTHRSCRATPSAIAASKLRAPHVQRSAQYFDPRRAALARFQRHLGIQPAPQPHAIKIDARGRAIVVQNDLRGRIQAASSTCHVWNPSDL